MRAKVTYVTLDDIDELLAPYEEVFEMSSDKMMELRRLGLLDTRRHARWAMLVGMRDEARRRRESTVLTMDVTPA